ncbi:zinc finger homeobox protein 4 [Drosophila yakuba]|uniref:zinc finger homeobox protein 4 n=1 Tax=Drosophila yakuba TaxID=7245 RepID=UPI001C8A36FD|nr:zinc finger homeobox protein 4 [Drosophila yakuba]
MCKWQHIFILFYLVPRRHGLERRGSLELHSALFDEIDNILSEIEANHRALRIHRQSCNKSLIQVNGLANGTSLLKSTEKQLLSLILLFKTGCPNEYHRIIPKVRSPYEYKSFHFAYIPEDGPPPPRTPPPPPPPPPVPITTTSTIATTTASTTTVPTTMPTTTTTIRTTTYYSYYSYYYYYSYYSYYYYYYDY